jgi:hypothetical protein
MVEEEEEGRTRRRGEQEETRSLSQTQSIDVHRMVTVNALESPLTIQL